MTENSVGALVIDERIHVIHSLALSNGSILVEIHLTAEQAAAIPSAFDWSLHAPDGTFVCRGRLAPAVWPDLSDIDNLHVTLSLGIAGKMAYQTVAV